MEQYRFVIECFVAGLAASVACGLGALPLAFERLELKQRIGLGYAFAGGLMIAASVYNLLDESYADPATQFHVQDKIAQDGRSFRLKLTYRF